MSARPLPGGPRSRTPESYNTPTFLRIAVIAAAAAEDPLAGLALRAAAV